jgi:hypothetical protein
MSSEKEKEFKEFEEFKGRSQEPESRSQEARRACLTLGRSLAPE